MNAEPRVCVVIPVHRQQPTQTDLISLNACMRVLTQHDVFLVCPEEMDARIYTEKWPGLQLMKVPGTWLQSIAAYNKMKIDPAFYARFSTYTHMLTYEPDAYVFRDELQQWAAADFDYIGAPFVAGADQYQPGAALTGVGNSGFSLRNISACRKVLAEIRSLAATAAYCNNPVIRALLRSFSGIEKILPGVHFTRIRIIRAYLHAEYTHEDVFWSVFIPRLLPYFRIAGINEAVRFSFDMAPEECYRHAQRQLPFGCHAWPKETAFWKPFIHIETHD
jgi:hypothetical protein